VGALGYEPFVGLATWRQADPTLLVEESVTAVVQIDGKVRGTLTVPARIGRGTRALARADEKVVRSLAGREIARRRPRAEGRQLHHRVVSSHEGGAGRSSTDAARTLIPALRRWRVEVSPPGHRPRTAHRRRRASRRRRRVGTGAALVLVLAAAAIAVAVGLVRSVATADTGVAVAPVEISAAALYVHVSGAVERPGSTAWTAERASSMWSPRRAGSRTPPIAAVNLARPLVDGEQVQVPEVGRRRPPASPSAVTDA
jgi:leucyl-tRNA synthetase